MEEAQAGFLRLRRGSAKSTTAPVQFQEAAADLARIDGIRKRCYRSAITGVLLISIGANYSGKSPPRKMLCLGIVRSTSS